MQENKQKVNKNGKYEFIKKNKSLNTSLNEEY